MLKLSYAYFISDVRLRKFEIRIGVHDEIAQNALCHYQEAYIPAGVFTNFVCATPLKGSIASVQMKGISEFLNMCEVEVMAFGPLSP